MSKAKEINERLNSLSKKKVLSESFDVTKIKPKFEVYEDNGGGLHLVVWDKNKIYVFHGYEYAHGNLAEDLKTLLNKGFNINNWDNEEDGKSFLKEVENSQYGYKLVADNEGIYWDDMGGNAKYEFKVLK
ncbi:MAG: hypothetical protein ACTTIS_01210 [Streptobacillus sp.]